jgi:hypothetical protein
MRSIMRRLSRVLVFAVAALAQPPIKPIPAAGIKRAGFFNEDWSL